MKSGDMNVDAACQVAHAISTSKVDFEMDFFTAVDDLKSRDEDAGAGMLGTVEFNSACFYRYANIDLGQLTRNLLGIDVNNPSPERIRDAQKIALNIVEAFLKASVSAIPTGKQNTFAAHNPPSLVFAVVRSSGLWSLANAFEKPVRADSQHGLIGGSVAALDSYWGKLVKGYGGGSVIGAAAFKLDEDPAFTALKSYEVAGVADVYDRVAQLIADHRGGAA
jgi:CRISPR system Cascade subunit CasC